MLKNYIFVSYFVLWGFSSFLISQEIKIFKVNDFDLKGNVKSCMVSTKYGKEEYDFNDKGFLTKSVTRYSNTDYDITYYKYKNGYLLEKRLESYRDNIFDSNTSIANIYTIDSLKSFKITEKIVSYNKVFLDQYEYYYNDDNQLISSVRTNNDGIDKTNIEYTNSKGGVNIKAYALNEVIYKKIRTSTTKAKDKPDQKVVFTVNFIEGNPNTALEEIYDTSNKLLLDTKFYFDEIAKKFTASEINTYSYDESQILSKKETKIGDNTILNEYIYQFDNGDSGNWIKKIITPENSYTTRKITYYPTAEVVNGDDEE